jgi:TetR/AcrR family transcriptional repressor of lmrAB and yxaGH operons
VAAAKSSDIPTRTRILDASGSLFRRHGYAATGIKAILAGSDAPYGSLYHHFPGGKQELGVAAIEAGGEFYRELVESVFRPDVDVVTATEAFFAGAAVVLEQTDFADACPIATIALEVASTSEPMRTAAAAAFESWLLVLEGRLVASGVGAERAGELAIEFFCAVEGAFLLCRTTRSTQPLDVVGRATRAAVAAAIPAEPSFHAGLTTSEVVEQA